jgi:hypothetical protein
VRTNGCSDSILPVPPPATLVAAGQVDEGGHLRRLGRLRALLGLRSLRAKGRTDVRTARGCATDFGAGRPESAMQCADTTIGGASSAVTSSGRLPQLSLVTLQREPPLLASTSSGWGKCGPACGSTSGLLLNTKRACGPSIMCSESIRLKTIPFNIFRVVQHTPGMGKGLPFRPKLRRMSH